MKRLAYLFILALSGCMVGPNYSLPDSCIPDEWDATPCSNEVAITDECALTDWWQVFDDPLLNSYIEMAARCNNNVLAAEANILQARALKQVTASKLYPQIDADFNALRIDLSKNGPLFGLAANPIHQPKKIFNLFNAIIDASWEIDLFGKTARNVEAASANIGSVIEQKNSILLSVLAEVAMNYIHIRSAQNKAFLIEENIEILEENNRIVEQQLQSGYRSSLDLEKIEAELATARAALPDVYAQMYLGIYALSVLTGNLPETFVDELLPMQPLPKPPCEIAVGLRSDLLRRRPDVRQAERQLALATANVGVAVASFFPSISLLGGIGFDSLRLSNLFQAGSKAWLIDGNISLPIFHGGSLIGNLNATEAATASAAFTYQQTVLNSLQEAETALVSFTQEIETAAQYTDAVEKTERVFLLTNERYIQGLSTLIDLLDSERQLNSAKQNLLNSDTSALLDLITLYKALGGGWEN